jgi:NAD(P)-dependent dehydrogenase (short-subunit alcohol dehydrogenase family)
MVRGAAVKDVVVVLGVGGMGMACARRLGPGRTLVVADHDTERLASCAAELQSNGLNVVSHAVDVSVRSSVDELAGAVKALGQLRTLVHTAGLSPTMASPARVLEVDMIGTDHVLAAFLPLAEDGTAAICIASMAGYMAGMSAELEHALAAAPTEDLLSMVGPVDDLDFGASYCMAKRVNQLRVEQAAGVWGARGGRVVTISPGIISTPMSLQELEEGAGDAMRQQLALSALPRMGTADDIAAAVEWLASPAASFVTGCDLRVDGGVTAAIHGLGLGLGMKPA